MHTLAVAQFSDQSIESNDLNRFSISKVFSTASSKVGSLGKVLVTEASLSFAAIGQKLGVSDMEAFEAKARRKQLKGVAAHAGVMFAVKSAVAAGMVGSASTLAPIFATVAASTAAATIIKIGHQAWLDRKNGENTFTGSIKKSFTSGFAFSTLKSQFAKASLGGALGVGLHSLLSHIDFSGFSLVSTAHAATLQQAQGPQIQVGPQIPAEQTVPGAPPKLELNLNDLPEDTSVTGGDGAVQNGPAALESTDPLAHLRALNESGAQLPSAAQAELNRALAGNSQAMKDFAIRELYGRGVEKNVDHAVELLKKSADLGNQQAVRDLAYLQRTGIYQPEREMTAALNRAEAERIARFTSGGTTAPLAAAPLNNIGPGNPAAATINDLSVCTAEPVSMTIGERVRNAFKFACSPLTSDIAQPRDSIAVQLQGAWTRLVMSGTAPTDAAAWMQNDALPRFTRDNASFFTASAPPNPAP